MTSRGPAVERALALLREHRAKNVTDAARQAGAPRSTVSRHWLNETGGENDTATVGRRTDLLDELEEDPDALDSEVPVFHLDYSDHDKHLMYPLSDIHVGSPHFAARVFRQWVDYLLDTPGVSMLFNGDGLNAAVIGSKSDTYSEKLTVGEATKVLRAELKPLADQGILDSILRGNHEQRIWRLAGLDPLEHIAEEFGVPYSPASMLLVYHVGDEAYKVFVRHGTGNGAATMGSQVNQLERAARVIDADVYLTSHTHTQAAFPKDLFRYELPGYTTPGEGALRPGGRAYPGGKVTRTKQLFVSTGSFLEYEPYAAERGFPPSHIGAPRIFFDGRRKDVHASV